MSSLAHFAEFLQPRFLLLAALAFVAIGFLKKLGLALLIEKGLFPQPMLKIAADYLELFHLAPAVRNVSKRDGQALGVLSSSMVAARPSTARKGAPRTATPRRQASRPEARFNHRLAEVDKGPVCLAVEKSKHMPERFADSLERIPSRQGGRMGIQKADQALAIRRDKRLAELGPWSFARDRQPKRRAGTRVPGNWSARR